MIPNGLFLELFRMAMQQAKASLDYQKVVFDVSLVVSVCSFSPHGEKGRFGC